MSLFLIFFPLAKRWVWEYNGLMRFQVILFGVRFFTLLSLVAWMGVLLFVDPEVSGSFSTALFLGTLFSFLSGWVTLMLVSLSRRFIGDQSTAVSFGALSRQGFLVSAYVIGVLMLLRSGFFSWWNALLLLAVVLLLELSIRRVTGSDTERP